MSTALPWLLEGIADVPHNESRVLDLTLDSREARAGTLFFALAGRQSHGLQFAQEAAARGASVVLWEPHADARVPTLPDGVFAAPVPGLRQLLGRIADRFFGWPSSHLRITGITGTNGKTTCAYLLAQCLEQLGYAAAYIGTLGWGRPAQLATPTHTTPDVISVHRQMAQLRAAGVREIAMEVSSHALDQERVAQVRFHGAAFTNLTRDHLDYHGTMTAYGAAKLKLLNLPDLQHLIVNVGDEFGRRFAHDYAGKVPMIAVWIGEGGSGWVAQRAMYAKQVSTQGRTVALELDGSFGAQAVRTQLLGRFNAENSLVVLACLASLGVPLAAAAGALAHCPPVPGRMELIEPGAHGEGRPVAVIDYAHSPDALSKALSAAREHCHGALWCVFGCGGDRDAGKRPLMGAIAAQLADEIIVTDDNPRSEDPQAITQGILSGIAGGAIPGNGAPTRAVRVIHDRGAAIATALREARAQDLVLIAGKGHEEYQIYGATRRSFSDKREALRSLGVAA